MWQDTYAVSVLLIPDACGLVCDIARSNTLLGFVLVYQNIAVVCLWVLLLLEMQIFSLSSSITCVYLTMTRQRLSPDSTVHNA